MIKMLLKKRLFFYAMFFIVLSGRIAMGAETGELLISNFDKPGERNIWRVINDGVMGGISSSTWNITENGAAVFAGNVSLEWRGRFFDEGGVRRRDI